jgi:hypothetical protein
VSNNSNYQSNPPPPSLFIVTHHNYVLCWMLNVTCSPVRSRLATETMIRSSTETADIYNHSVMNLLRTVTGLEPMGGRGRRSRVLSSPSALEQYLSLSLSLSYPLLFFYFLLSSLSLLYPLLFFLTLSLRSPLWFSGQYFWLQIQRSRVRFPALPDYLKSSESETGSTHPREYSWRANWKK